MHPLWHGAMGGFFLVGVCANHSYACRGKAGRHCFWRCIADAVCFGRYVGRKVLSSKCVFCSSGRAAPCSCGNAGLVEGSCWWGASALPLAMCRSAMLRHVDARCGAQMMLSWQRWDVSIMQDMLHSDFGRPIFSTRIQHFMQLRGSKVDQRKRTDRPGIKHRQAMHQAMYAS